MSAYVRPADLMRLREIDALSFLLANEPQNLKREGRDYRLKDEPSCVVNAKGFFAWGRGRGGKSAIDFLETMRGIPFLEACKIVDGTKVIEHKLPPLAPKGEFVLPDKYHNCEKVKVYLQARGIDSEIIDYCIQNGLIYEEKQYHTAVFVGYSSRDKPAYGFIRATIPSSYFRREIKNSEKKYSFRICNNSDTVNVFESCIDSLAFASLLKNKSKVWLNQDYLSLGGVYQGAKWKAEKLEKYPALVYYLEQNPQVKTICLCFDNDHIGREAAFNLKNILRGKYEVKVYFSPLGKDWADYATIKLEEQER